MKIALRDPEKLAFWSLPNSNIQLTFQSPGPIEFDPTGLSPQQRQILWTALARQVLACSGAQELINLLRPPAPVQQIALPPEVEVSSPSIVSETLEVKEVKEEKKIVENLPIETKPTVKRIIDSEKRDMKNLLKFKVDTLRRELPKQSTSNLSLLLGLERNGKNRKKIIELISGLIRQREVEVLNSIGSCDAINSDMSPMEKQVVFQGVKRNLFNNVGDVVESEKEEITILIGDVSDE